MDVEHPSGSALGFLKMAKLEVMLKWIFKI
jgi:hypothetical protein